MGPLKNLKHKSFNTGNSCYSSSLSLFNNLNVPCEITWNLKGKQPAHDVIKTEYQMNKTETKTEASSYPGALFSSRANYLL